MNLLEEIQAGATDSSFPLPDLLRKCAVLAARLKNDDFSKWVSYELNGYPDVAELPAYRTLKVQSFGHFAGTFGRSATNLPIAPSCIRAEFRHHVESSPMLMPIAAVTEMLDQGKSASFKVNWPGDLIAMFGQDIYQDMNCIGAWKVVSRGQIAGVADTVRNRILAFVLGIEEAAPDPGVWPTRSAPLPVETVQQVFNTHIGGDVGSVVTAGASVTVGSLQVTPGDLTSLIAALGALGIQRGDLDDLRSSVERDGRSADRKSLGGAVTSWIGKMIGKASEGALGVAAKAAATTITDLVLRYYGLK